MASRSLNFVTLLYPEHFSSWDEICDRLDDLHVSGILSPLHDKDKTSEGNLKKAHYHLLLCFDSVKTITQVEDYLNEKQIFHKGLAVCASKSAYARYLCHLDSPEKAQYNIQDCVFFGGISPHVMDKEIDASDATGRMLDYIHTYQFEFFCDLVDFLKINDYDLYVYVSKHTQSFVFNYIKSFGYKNKQEINLR